MDEFKRYADREYYEKKVLYHRMIVDLASNKLRFVNKTRECTEENILVLDILKDIIKKNQADLDSYKDLLEKQQKKEAEGDGEEG